MAVGGDEMSRYEGKEGLGEVEKKEIVNEECLKLLIRRCWSSLGGP